MIPYAYEFKRLAPQLRMKSTYGFFLESVEAAPVYYFADQAAFDSDDLNALSRLIMAEPLKLPHPAVIFEVRDRDPQRAALLVYARQFEDRVEAALFSRDRKRLRWTDCLAHAVFAQPGWAEVTAHPKISQDQAQMYHDAVSGYGLACAQHLGLRGRRQATQGDARPAPQMCQGRRARLDVAPNHH